MPHEFAAQFDALHKQAAQAIGLDDFGSDDYREPMRLLLADYDRHARFSESGAAMVAGEIVGKLIGRLLAQQGFKQHPQLANAPVTKPIIIVGLPRTGSTALHRLISASPDNQALELWLGSMPMPRPPRETWESNPFYQQVAKSLDQLYALFPELCNVHPIFADQADECRFALDQTFWATDMAQTATAPEYGEWCLNTDARYAYRHYRRLLGLVAGGDTRRWVLKNPDHLYSLDALLDVFPDACIVQTHREPVTSLTSVASLSYGVLQHREPVKTRLEHGRDMSIWLRALEKAESIRQRTDPSRFFDLHIDEIRADQVGAVERIYQHFGLPVSDAVRAAWKDRASNDPTSGHGAHDYAPEQWGYSRDAVRAQAPKYCERYEAVSAKSKR